MTNELNAKPKFCSLKETLDFASKMRTGNNYSSVSSCVESMPPDFTLTK